MSGGKDYYKENIVSIKECFYIDHCIHRYTVQLTHTKWILHGIISDAYFKDCNLIRMLQALITMNQSYKSHSAHFATLELCHISGQKHTIPAMKPTI